MAHLRFVTILSMLLGSPTSLFAQGAAVVQLPSYSMFGVNTSVSVPDRGSVSLGGIGRSSIGSTAFGPTAGLRNRGFGRNLSGSVTSVRATIHDFDALDRATLQGATDPRMGRRSLSAADQARRRLTAARQSSAGRVPGSVAEARRQRAAEEVAYETEVTQDLKHARHAAAAGKTHVAAMFYKAAARHSTGTLRLQVEKETAALDPQSSKSNSRRNSPPDSHWVSGTSALMP
jgi:hypothetical protein